MREIPEEKRGIVDALQAGTIAERDRLAAFVVDEATTFAANPFPSTTAGVARQRWGLREIEFEVMEVATAGLPCLMASLGGLPAGEALRQEILRSPRHVLYLLRRGEGGPIAGAVLHGNSREALPPFTRPEPVAKSDPVIRRAPAKRSARKPVVLGQLEMFGTAAVGGSLVPEGETRSRPRDVVTNLGRNSEGSGEPSQAASRTRARGRNLSPARQSARIDCLGPLPYSWHQLRRATDTPRDPA